MMASSGSGYAYTFVITPPGALLCQICQLVAREPQLSVCCGNNFCKLCLEKRISEEGGCPSCDDSDVFFTTFPNKLSDREIKKLLILCQNKDKGCKWRDELEKTEDHLRLCEFEDVQCPGGCEMLVQRQNVTTHLQNECLHRQVNCEHCHVTGEYGWIIGQHRDTCAKLPLACPNECGLTDITRSELKQHLRKCPLQKVYCRFRTMGCEAMILSGSQGEHDDTCMKEHFQLMRNELVKTKEELIDLKLQVGEGRFYKSWDDKPKEVELASKHQKKNEPLFPLEDDLLHQNEVQHLQDLNAKLHGKLDVVTTELHRTQEEFAHWKMINGSFLSKLLSTLDWETRLELSSSLTSQTELVAPVIMKITNVSHKKDHRTVYKSPIFLTHENGYRVYVHIIPGGKGYRVTQFSVHIKLIKDLQHGSKEMQSVSPKYMWCLYVHIMYM